MRILICGDRNWCGNSQYGSIFDAVNSMGKVEMIITGDCKGVDSLAYKVGNALNIPVLTFFANWALYGKAAGPIRNERMLKEGEPDIVLAFHDNVVKSKGTKNMVLQAICARVPVEFFNSKGERYTVQTYELLENGVKVK